MYLYIYIALIAGQLISDPSNTENTEYLIRHYTIEDGLPVNSVNGIVQDIYGYLYMSTHDGLVRFDGYEFKVYNSGNTKGMASNRIAGLIKTDVNTIWLFNENGSVTSKSGDSFRTFSSPEVPGPVYRLVRDNDDRVWVAGREGIAYFDEKTSAFTKITDPVFSSGSEVIGEGIDSGIFAVNDTGLVSWKNGISELLLSESDFPIAKNLILEIVQIQKETAWLLGRGGFFSFNLATKEVGIIHKTEKSNTSFWNIHPKNDGQYLLNGSDGYYTFDPERNSLESQPPTMSTISARTELIFEGSNQEEILIGDDEVVINGVVVLQTPAIKFGFLDKEGSIWIGSETQGLFQIRKSSFINLTTETSPGLSNVYSIAEDDSGNFWTCSLNEGITRISSSGIKNWRSLSDINITQCAFLFLDNDGAIYAGLNDHTILKFVNEKWSIFLRRNQQGNELSLTYPEAVLRKGKVLFIGHSGPLLTYQEDEGLKGFDSQSLTGIQTFAMTSDEVIYAGTSGNGLIRIEGGAYRSYSAEEGFLTSNIIRDIFLQSDDTLWIATENLGLNRLVIDEFGEVVSVASVTSEDGLPHNSLHRIIEDDFGNLWISSNGGIMRVSRSELNAFADKTSPDLRVLDFDEKDGMVNREANGGRQSAGILASDGRIWFPNQKGVTIIDPSDFLMNQNIQSPSPVFESLESAGKEYLLTGLKELTLPKNQRDLRVNFTAPGFAYQDRVLFSYKLDGVIDEWQPANQSRQAVFTGVPPGTHFFTIRSQLIGNEAEEASLMIVIPYRFYETIWFGFLVFFGVIGLIYTGFQIRVKSLKETERKLKERVDNQTKELKEAAEQKQRFFTGITHELKTPLSLILGPLDDIVSEPDKTDPKVFLNRLELMQQNSLRLQNLVDQILDVSKLNANAISLSLNPENLAELTRNIIGQFQSRLDQDNLKLEYDIKEPNATIYVDREAWERVLINLMSNAIKFSPEGGKITVSIKHTGEQVSVSVKDEGTGIAPHEQEKVFEYLYQTEGSKAAEGTGIGLFLARGLIKEMGGEIRINPEYKKGAEFIITLIKGYTHLQKRHHVTHEQKALSPFKPLPEKTEPILEEAVVHYDTEAVLVVEDNRDFQNYMKSILEEKYTVYTAGDGNEALEILGMKSPDLILSDIMMPGMNGLEFVKKLRSEKRFKSLPVIFLSAKNQDIDAEEGLSTGADVYLTKPIGSKMLLTQVEAVLRRERVLRGEALFEGVQEKSGMVHKVREIIYRHLGNTSLTVNQLAEALFISRTKLYNEWNTVSDISINEYIKKIRLEEAKLLLKEKGFTVQEAARAVGYSDPNYFSTSFKKHFGMNPSEV